MRSSIVAVAVLAALATGCGVFKSSTSQASWESSSDSSSSSSKSSSDDDASSQALQRDVQTVVAAEAARGADPAGLRRGVGEVAATHGLVDWERSDAVYLAIGRGFSAAGIDRARAETLGRDLAAGRRRAADLVLAGWSEPIAR